jgi:chemotaxis signal transduction protein
MISTPDDAQTFLRCTFADQPFFVDAASVAEVRSAAALDADPGPDGRLGFAGDGASRFAVHGMTDLSERTVEAFSPTAGTWLLLRGEPPRALWVDRVFGETRVSGEQVLALPEWIFRRSSRWFSALVRSEEELTPVFWPGRCGVDPSSPLPAAPAALPDPPAGDTAGGRLTLCALTESSPGSRPLTIGLSNRQVVEVVESQPTARVPGLSPPIEGFFVWRERLVPWVDLAGWLRLVGDSPARKHLLIARVPETTEPFGFSVLPSVRLLALPVEHQRCRRRLPVAGEHLKAAIELWRETVLFPDFQKLTALAEPPSGSPFNSNWCASTIG